MKPLFLDLGFFFLKILEDWLEFENYTETVSSPFYCETAGVFMVKLW